MESVSYVTPIEPGQKVAACVQYTKKRKEWILAAVSKFLPESNEYIVKDLFPDGRKKVDSWKVKWCELLRYPTPSGEELSQGDRVLSLWLMESNEWSSMFYEASVWTSTETEVGLRFAGDDTVHPIPRSKVVKLSGHNGNSRVLAVGKEKAKSLLANLGSRPADDSGPARESSPELMLDYELPKKRSKRDESSSPSASGSPTQSPGSPGETILLFKSPVSPSSSHEFSAAPVPMEVEPVLSPKPQSLGEFASGCGVIQKKIMKYHQLLQERAKQQRRAV
jgi:hypothetical protein